MSFSAGRRVAPFLLLPLLAACGGGSGFRQNIAVSSEPVGAACRVTQGEAVLAQVAATPGVASVPKSSNPIAIACEAPNHLPARLDAASRQDGAMVAAYALTGGLVGIMAASASGDLYRYPDAVTVRLAPQRFADAAARDAFFDAREAEATAFGEAVLAARPACGAGDTGCENRRAADRAATEARLSELRTQRASAAVGP
ncbi:hypothetical protein [Falsiroseomonas stagni]|uniref:Lipoprotein n=1 Tax=Falsiroseomonas stagni DSM 19981 TaxID=1123062 RepID=A0A1I4C088_9PROT|nr:hypothetical protein [Falsiroseomonas stagni]SFK73827.1 hypothetical protein SAMN02745775_106255 [Falsiroseomonas stagni DSM 19981]